MTGQNKDAFRDRIAKVRAEVDIASVIGAAGVQLGRGDKPRGKCPFHGSKSDSLAVDRKAGHARCWGCDWHGDVLRFVQDYYQVPFVEALRKLEDDHGLSGLRAAPAKRQKVERAGRSVEAVDSAVMAAHIDGIARPGFDECRTYFRSRGIPDRWLTEERLCDFRFVGLAPIAAWPVNKGPDSVPCAPAIVAQVRRPGDWSAMGLHVTYLRPDLAGKMVRKRRDGSDMPARKMLGAVAGGGVLLGHYDPTAPLYVGEGNETVLSGMEVLKAPDNAIGLAALSLSNLQGAAQLVRGALPLFDIIPDAARAAALTWERPGLVVGLVDADMAPLRGMRDRQTGQWLGVPVMDRPRGPIVRRAVSTAERAEICAQLFVQAWRLRGCRVTAARPPMGQDFNDVLREGL
ncbi:CHC2 zinc finger domain-containing protein [Sphingomonas sp. Leaf257]|uniref:CHC2 zinc finger domain-containing protein n=1 Tax=Sphingomonas sp. Leaf257 TaxID=1736309 RepID=UPI0006F9506B|nr:CHC2 zinc finger domain-containing protein [Sphingomonas sp. Leaf257]KQO57684.1 DNA primase [Sphingomonas sp. Leaf257]